MEKEIEILVLTENTENVPTYASKEAAGADCRANLKEPLTILPGCSQLIPTGLKVEIPIGFEIQVRPRSGLALKNQITVLNTPGTIDSDYRGEIGIILINHGKENFIVTPGMRIAQLVVAKSYRARFVQVQTTSTTMRGSGGFGHTGVN